MVGHLSFFNILYKLCIITMIDSKIFLILCLAFFSYRFNHFLNVDSNNSSKFIFKQICNSFITFINEFEDSLTYHYNVFQLLKNHMFHKLFYKKAIRFFYFFSPLIFLKMEKMSNHAIYTFNYNF